MAGGGGGGGGGRAVWRGDSLKSLGEVRRRRTHGDPEAGSPVNLMSVILWRHEEEEEEEEGVPEET